MTTVDGFIIGAGINLVCPQGFENAVIFFESRENAQKCLNENRPLLRHNSAPNLRVVAATLTVKDTEQ